MGVNTRVRKHKFGMGCGLGSGDGNGQLKGRSLRVFKAERDPAGSPGDKTCVQISVLSTWARLALIPAYLLPPLPACGGR